MATPKPPQRRRDKRSTSGAVPPFDDIAELRPVVEASRRLEQLRLSAEDVWIAAELELGHHDGIVGPAIEMARAHPLREQRWEQAMLALYRCGRHGEALRVYQEAHAALATELGLEPSPALRNLEIRILDQDQDLLRRAQDDRENESWPSFAGSFVGRVADITTVLSSLEPGHLTTLVGVGGVGKTRLAAAVAEHAASGYRDGIWFTDLASIDSEAEVARHVARAVGLLQSDPTSYWLELLSQHLANRVALIILDNCEHVPAAAKELVKSLQKECSGVTIVATSRTALGVPGERTIPIEPLEVPTDINAPLHQLADNPSVQLLADRIREVDQRFQLTSSAAPRLANVARVLDGIPLAIELAATRTRSMSVDQLSERLEDRMAHLVGPPGTHRRQLSVGHAIDWSLELLSGRARLLFARLAVFPSSFTLEAAEAVCSATPLDPADIADDLDGLVANSLLTVSRTTDGLVSFRMLQPVRAPAVTHLSTSGEEAFTQERHADYVFGRAAQLADSVEAGDPRSLDEVPTASQASGPPALGVWTTRPPEPSIHCVICTASG